MRLLYFSRDYTTHDHRFLSALAKSDLQTFYMRLEQRSYTLEERSLPPEIEIVQWSGGNAPARFRDGLRLLTDLKRVIRRIQPDIILAGPLQLCALLVALSGFKPLVSMSWGYDLLQDARRNAAWAWATRYSLRRSAAMVGDCETIRNLAVSYGMRADRIVTFPWGIDLQHFTPGRNKNPTDQGNKPFTLLSTRGWEPIYGVDLIARAFVNAAAARPELRLVMLANGSLAAQLRQTYGRAGLDPSALDGKPSQNPGRVIFPGQVGYTELPRYYRAADLYISASHSDGSSISLLEAMACGCPVLVSDIPGNREWVSHGQNGWLFPDGDVQALTQAIVDAVEQRGRLVEMGFRARQTAEARADWQKNFPKLLQAFEIAQKPSSHQ